jgi:hypothetical protein
MAASTSWIEQALEEAGEVTMRDGLAPASLEDPSEPAGAVAAAPAVQEVARPQLVPRHEAEAPRLVERAQRNGVVSRGCANVEDRASDARDGDASTHRR